MYLNRRGFLGGLCLAPSLLHARPQAAPAPAVPVAPAEYNTWLADAINRLIAPVYRTKITLLEQPAQGDFMWYYQNLNQQFNEGTLDFIGANVVPGALPGMARLSSAGSFQNAWVQVLTGTVFALSNADVEQTNQYLSAAEVQSQEVVTDYQAIWGNIDDAAMAAARAALPQTSIENKFDYITAYVMGYVWSGASQAKAPALTAQQMSHAANLASLLPKAPASARRLIVATSRTFALQGQAAVIQAEQQQGRWMLSQMIANVTGPAAANGGMQTVNPNTGAVSEAYQPGYSVRRSLSSIQNDLANERRVLRVGIPVSQNASGPLVKFSTDNNMRAIAGAGKESVITIEYRGYSLVPVGPAAWQQVSNRGWYYADPVAQAAKNGSRDVTGFRFVSEPAFNLKTSQRGRKSGFSHGRINQQLSHYYRSL